MRELEKKTPAVAEAFKKGLFTIAKTSRRFSAIGIDQAHEQNNAIVKGDGGAVGLTENAGALRRWMLSGPEMARLVNEFEEGMVSEVTPELFHHEDEKGFQKSFHKDVKSFVQVLEEFGNPFEDDSKDLTVLDTKVLADKEGVSRMQNIEELGKKQLEAFISERIKDQKKPLADPITRNKISFFEAPVKKKTSKVQQQFSSMKSDCSLFSRLYIVCQTRNGDLDEFFKHENQSCPPSISVEGDLRLPHQKSGLATCLKALTTPKTVPPADSDVTVMDGAALANMIKPSTEDKTFSDYAFKRFVYQYLLFYLYLVFYSSLYQSLSCFI